MPLLNRLAGLGLALILLTGCTAAPTENLPPIATPTMGGLPTLPTGAVFQVIDANGVVTLFGGAELGELPLGQITVEEKVEEGPRLLDVLAAAGITSFTEVTLTGPESTMTLTTDQVDEQVLLDLTNRGTVKLASPYVPKVDWVKDITLIQVK